MKVTKMMSHNFPLPYHETFRKIKLKVSRGQSGILSEVVWTWGYPGKERQQKEATSTYLQGLLILQAQLLWGGSRKLSQSVISWMAPCFAGDTDWPPQRQALLPHSLQHAPVSWVKVVLTNQSPGWHPLEGSFLILRKRVGRKYHFKGRTQNQVCRNRKQTCQPWPVQVCI